MEKWRFLKAADRSRSRGQRVLASVGRTRARAGTEAARLARKPGAWPGRSRPPGVALLRRRRRAAALPRVDESAVAERAAPASARAPERRAKKPRARPGAQRPAATAGGGRASRARRPALAAEGDGCPPTWRCVGLWRAPAGARSRRPPTPRGQPPGQGPQAPPPRR